MKQAAHKPTKKEFSTFEVKKWAIDDMNKTKSWLDSQEEKVSKIGLLCL